MSANIQTSSSEGQQKCRLEPARPRGSSVVVGDWRRRRDRGPTWREPSRGGSFAIARATAGSSVELCEVGDGRLESRSIGSARAVAVR